MKVRDALAQFKDAAELSEEHMQVIRLVVRLVLLSHRARRLELSGTWVVYDDQLDYVHSDTLTPEQRNGILAEWSSVGRFALEFNQIAFWKE
jgi:hypothetical protein